MNKNNFIEDLKTAIRCLEKGQEISGSELASLISAIADIELEEGGPYALVESKEYGADSAADAADRADTGLNLLIAYFLLLCEVSLPKLDEFLDRRLESDRIISVFLDSDEFYNIMQRWKAGRTQASASNTGLQYAQDERRMMDMIMAAAKKRFKNLSPDLKEFAMKGIKKTISGNPDKQMSLMSYYTKQALGKAGDKVSDELVAEMGLANIFFWTAFIIYDDFWDEDENADPHILPTANLYARSYVDFFDSVLPEQSGFREFFHGLMDQLDGANTWETVDCRTQIHGSKFVIPEKLPDYGDYESKYLPAAGHILGPVAILMKSGYGIGSSEVKNLISYFRNYLIAMQINDDAHDWEEDMRRGHLSTVVVMLLEDLKWPKKEIDLDADLVELKKVFWFKTIIRAAQTAVLHTENSRKALQSIAFRNPAPLERIVNMTENVAKKALQEQKKSVDFLKSYEN